MAKASKKAAPIAEAPAVEEAKATKSRGVKGVELGAVITLLVTANPKREGSKAKERFAFYVDGMTQEQALDAGITTPDLVYDASHGFISIDGYAPTLIPMKEKKEKAPKAEKAPKKGKAAPADEELE